MLPVTTTSSSCPFAATVCFVLAASTRFLQLPERSVFSFPTHRRSDFLGVIHPSFEFCLTHNSSKSYDFSELPPPTQPTTSTSIDNYYAASIVIKTFNFWFPEKFCWSTLFLAKWLLTLRSSSTVRPFFRLVHCILRWQGLPALHLLHNLGHTKGWRLLSILLHRNIHSGSRRLTVHLGLLPFHAMQQSVLLPREADFRYLTICVTFGVSPFGLHLIIGLSPILQSSEEPAFIVSFYYYKTFKVEITV